MEDEKTNVQNISHDEENSSFIEQREFNIKTDNDIYNLICEIDSQYIYFFASAKNNFQFKLENKYKIKSIVNILEVFPSKYPNLKRILYLIERIYNKNRISIDDEDKDNVYLVVKLSNEDGEMIDHKIKLIKSSLTIDDKFKIILNEVTSICNNKENVNKYIELIKKQLIDLNETIKNNEQSFIKTIEDKDKIITQMNQKTNDQIKYLNQNNQNLTDTISTKFEEHKNQFNEFGKLMNDIDKKLQILIDNNKKKKEFMNSFLDDNGDKLFESFLNNNKKIGEYIEDEDQEKKFNDFYNKDESINNTIEEKEIEENDNNINNSMKSSFISQKIFKESKILKNSEEIEVISKAFLKKFNKKVHKTELLYKASHDGDSAEQFHSKCDNIGNTLVLIETIKGKRFGGFTSKYWNQTNGFKFDDKEFLFSLNNKKYYSSNKDSKGICCDHRYGPIFGEGYNIFISSNCLSNEYSLTSQFSFQKDNKTFELNGEMFFKVKEYEVFKVHLK